MCRILVWVLITLYLFALAIFVIGNFGLFGTQADPLAGVYLVILGQPWNRLVDLLPESAWPYASALSPICNILVLSFFCRWLSNRRAQSAD